MELKVGDSFWARQVIGSHGPCGDPMDFTIVGETKTLWKCKRTSLTVEQVAPFSIKKDGSEYAPLSEEKAQQIIWLRTNANKIGDAVRQLTKNAFAGDVAPETYQTLKAIAAIVGIP